MLRRLRCPSCDNQGFVKVVGSCVTKYVSFLVGIFIVIASTCSGADADHNRCFRSDANRWRIEILVDNVGCLGEVKQADLAIKKQLGAICQHAAA